MKNQINQLEIIKVDRKEMIDFKEYINKSITEFE